MEYSAYKCIYTIYHWCVCKFHAREVGLKMFIMNKYGYNSNNHIIIINIAIAGVALDCLFYSLTILAHFIAVINQINGPMTFLLDFKTLSRHLTYTPFY